MVPPPSAFPSSGNPRPEAESQSLSHLGYLLSRVFTLAFTFLVFVILYWYTRANRPIISYVGVMLMVTMIYLEMLVIRDQLWVLEGSLMEARKWRDVFFPRQALSQLRWRKVVVILFAAGLFSWVYFRLGGDPIYSFLGVILMVTVLYFEALTIRDEVKILSSTINAWRVENAIREEAKSREPVPAVPPESPDGLAPKEDAE